MNESSSSETMTSGASRKRKQAVDFRTYVPKLPDHPLTEDLLELASLAGIPIPKQLGTVVIHMLKENVAPLGIRTILHRILQNCQTKRMAQGKSRDLTDKETVDDEGISDCSDGSRHTLLEWSTATRYLIDNLKIINDSDYETSQQDEPVV